METFGRSNRLLLTGKCYTCLFLQNLMMFICMRILYILRTILFNKNTSKEFYSTNIVVINFNSIYLNYCSQSVRLLLRDYRLYIAISRYEKHPWNQCKVCYNGGSVVAVVVAVCFDICTKCFLSNFRLQASSKAILLAVGNELSFVILPSCQTILPKFLHFPSMHKSVRISQW